MVLAHDFLEVDAAGTFVTAQGLHRGRAGGGGNGLAVQVLDAGDAGVGLGGNTHFFHVRGHRERHILLAGHVVGGGAAFQVHGAVLHQGNTVLRGHRGVGDGECLAGGLVQVIDDALGHFRVETHVLAVAQGEGQCGRVTHAQADAATGLDLGQRVCGLCKGTACGDGCDGQGQQLLLHKKTPE